MIAKNLHNVVAYKCKVVIFGYKQVIKAINEIKIYYS
jgi:hypothetical protein